MNHITYIGITNYQSRNNKFGIKENDRSGHIYCIGKTGVGKSTLLLNMAISDIINGNGIGIIDPHGDISESILDHIPQDRINDVVYFNTSDLLFPIAFNPLYDVAITNHHLVASSLVITFKKIWSESWGPRLEHILRNSILTLLHYPNATLLDIQTLLTNSDFRNEVLHHLKDKALLNFWYKEFYAIPPSLKAEAISPIVNKVGLLQTHPLLRNIIGQKTSTFSISDVMNQKKIFIANLSKGVLGEDASQLLGSLLVTQFQMAALSRVSMPEGSRIPFYLYIDEMHSFVTLSFVDILAESRKYGLALFLTHQYIDQLNEKILAAIIGNVGTIICFRIGASDASVIGAEFKPVLQSDDLVSLPQFGMYIKLLIDGTTSKPFSAYTLPPAEIGVSYKLEVINASQKEYGRAKEVEDVNVDTRYINPIVENGTQSLF